MVSVVIALTIFLSESWPEVGSSRLTPNAMCRISGGSLSAVVASQQGDDTGNDFLLLQLHDLSGSNEV
jgi:hypothetical protein